MSKVLKINNIDTVEFVNPIISHDFREDKISIFDVKITLSTGELINIEMQKASHSELSKRIIYYNSLMYSAQLDLGDKYEKFKKAITIVFCDFDIFKDDEGFHFTFHFNEDHKYFMLDDSQEIHILSLPKAKGDEEEFLVAWLNFIGAKTKEDLIMAGSKHEIIQNAYDELLRISSDPEIREQYFALQKSKNHEHDIRIEEHENGLKEGIEIGRDEGRDEERERIIKVMYNNGNNIEVIANMLSISVEEVSLIVDK